MTSIDYPLSADDEFDDLPRTIRRERDAREREARDREAYGRSDPPFMSRAGAVPEYGAAYSTPDYSGVAYAGEPVSAIVKRFDVPFIRLAAFFMKAVVAAIPALVLLGAILWLAGDIVQTYFPSLVKMQIFIHFPE